MFRRLLGLLLLLIGITGVILSVAGIIVGRQLVDTIGAGIRNNLQLTLQSLDTVEETLLLAKQTIGDVSVGLDTVEATTTDLGQTINQSRPLIDQVNQVTSHQVPDSIETVQTTIPGLAEVAGIIDDTLVALNDFRIDENILGLNIQYDLGVNYNPTVPFDEAVLDLGDSLDGLPETLRSLEIYLNVTRDNLQTISQGLFAVARDLDVVNERIAAVDPLLNEYIRIVNETRDNTSQVRAQVEEQLEMIKLVITVLMVWLGLTQIAPLYLGWELLTGRRERVVEPVVVPEPVVLPEAV
ncbi:MAG TPA: hypothetical protein VF177_14450, partial [Anaerolineae bacterium]